MEDLKNKIEILAKKSTEQNKPHEAMQFAQAALNLAHAYATMRGA